MSPVSNWTPPVGPPEGERSDDQGNLFPPPTPPAPESTPPTLPPPPPTDQPVTPRYGELAPPGWVPPQVQSTGWTPPPPPGLIPLRPLTLGDVLAASFKVMRRNPRPTYGFALVYGMLTALVVAGASALAVSELLSRLAYASTATLQDITSGTLVGAFALFLVTLVVSYALGAVPQGIIALEVARGTLGEKSTLRSLWAGVKGRMWALVGWLMLVSLVGAVLLLAITAIALTPVIAGGGEAVAGFATLGLFGLLMIGGAVLAIWIATKLAYVPSALIIERATLRHAVARSWRLTGGRFWRTLGPILLLGIILQLGISIVTTPIELVGSMLLYVVDPTGSTQGLALTAVLVSTVVAIVSTVFTAVATVAQAAAPALLYIDARIRKEGLDVELQRAAEERAAGRDPGDPYTIAR